MTPAVVSADVARLEGGIALRYVATGPEGGARGAHMPAGMFEALVEHSLRIPARIWRAVVDAVAARMHRPQAPGPEAERSRWRASSAIASRDRV